jgi:hypothetical protein
VNPHLPRKCVCVEGCNDVFGGEGDRVHPSVELVEKERGRGADRVGEDKLGEADYLVGRRTAAIFLGRSADAAI